MSGKFLVGDEFVSVAETSLANAASAPNKRARALAAKRATLRRDAAAFV